MGIDRRHFLRLSATLASGVVVPASFTACSREEEATLARCDFNSVLL